MEHGEPPQHHAGRRLAIARLALFGALVGCVLAYAALTDSLPTPEEARDWGESLGPFAPLAYAPLFVVANFLIPWPILAGAGGLLFGTLAATPLAVLGVTGAALAQMAVSRRLAGEHAGLLLPERTRAIEDFLQRNGAVAVMESRIVPILPWGAVNYSAGLTRLRMRDMALGTLVGSPPKVFGYVALGGSLTDLGSLEAKLAVGLLVVLAAAGALLVRRQLLSERGAASA
jgi:uncharacterized membrane protein YdjX (TVP38/TMEM64 family)